MMKRITINRLDSLVKETRKGMHRLYRKGGAREREGGGEREDEKTETKIKRICGLD